MLTDYLANTKLNMPTHERITADRFRSNICRKMPDKRVAYDDSDGIYGDGRGIKNIVTTVTEFDKIGLDRI